MKISNAFAYCALILVFIGCSDTEEKEGNKNSKEDRPNIILIMTDDQGYGDVGFHGNANIQTPNIDKLAQESIRFTNFHSGTTCSPTRAGLMTGINCNRTGTWHTILGRSLLSNRFPTIAQYLQDAGYKTGMFGKWHLGDNYPFRPEDRGFEEVFRHGGGGVGQTPDYWNNDYFDDTYWHNGIPEKQSGYCTDIWFQGAMDFIETRSKQDAPFFCYLVTNAPHGPFHVAQKYINLYKDNSEVPNPNFYGMISNVDENMGRLDQKLDKLGLKENTLLIFMTDNGTAAGVKLDKDGHVVEGFNSGMRGLKGSEYEGGHRVPLFVRFPTNESLSAKSHDQLVTHTDLVPTLLEYTGTTPKNVPDFDGQSILPLLTTGEQSDLSERVVVVDRQRQEYPEKWKNASVMQNTWRLINNRELYDLSKDPGQKNNVIADHQEKAKMLETAYEAWWKRIEPDFSHNNNIVIGTEYENPTYVTCHDWHSDTKSQSPWHQIHVRAAKENNGHWLLEVSRPGNYQVRLHRWPPHLKAGFNATIPEGDIVSGGNPFKPGVGLNIKTARIKIQDKEMTADKINETYYEFALHLEKGPTRLQTWCTDDQGIERGAYFVELEYQP